MEIKLTAKQKELIERMGVYSERSGIPPAQARILALLIISDKTELTFDEILQTLKLSKSAVSNAINVLLLNEQIEYCTKPGDRKRYFQSRIAHFGEDFEKRFSHLLKAKAFFKEVLENRTKTTKEFNAGLKRVIDFMEFMEKELPQLHKKWKQMNRSNP